MGGTACEPGESRVDPAQIAWVPYDAFLDTTLSAALWEYSNGAVVTGGPGLVLTPAPLSDLGQSNAGIRASFPIGFGDYFASRVLFTVTQASVDLHGAADFNIDICGPVQELQCVSLGWAMGNDVTPLNGGAALTGTFFHQDDDTRFVIAPTSSSSGQMAMTYAGGVITSYFDYGTGWQTLGSAFSPPLDWVPIRFELDADATIFPPVPEPASSLLGCAGLLTVWWAGRPVAGSARGSRPRACNAMGRLAPPPGRPQG